MSDEELMKEQFENNRKIYDQFFGCYQEIDSFRAQLLGRLPLATVDPVKGIV